MAGNSVSGISSERDRDEYFVTAWLSGRVRRGGDRRDCQCGVGFHALARADGSDTGYCSERPWTETIGEQIQTGSPAEFPQMVLWTKPPPAIEPPPPPPTLRLNAQLLAVRDGNAGEPAVATLYLVDTEEIVRLPVAMSCRG